MVKEGAFSARFNREQFVAQVCRVVRQVADQRYLDRPFTLRLILHRSALKEKWAARVPLALPVLR
jgi:hypothetical protein